MFLTHEQTRLEHLAMLHVRRFIPYPEVAVMVRPEGRGLGVGLVYEDGGHKYVVRDVFPPYEADQAVYFRSHRLAHELAGLHRRVQAALSGERYADEACGGV